MRTWAIPERYVHGVFGLSFISIDFGADQRPIGVSSTCRACGQFFQALGRGRVKDFVPALSLSSSCIRLSVSVRIFVHASVLVYILFSSGALYSIQESDLAKRTIRVPNPPVPNSILPLSTQLVWLRKQRCFKS